MSIKIGDIIFNGCLLVQYVHLGISASPLSGIFDLLLIALVSILIPTSLCISLIVLEK